MTPRPCLVGVDVGTSTIKVGAFDPSGRNLATASLPTPMASPRRGWSEHDPEELWHAVVSTLRGVIGQLDHDDWQVAGAGVVSVGEAGVLLDRYGRPLDRMFAWFDDRATSEAEDLRSAIGDEQLHASTGMSLTAHNAIAKLQWVNRNEPETWSAARHWLGAADYVAYRLTGEVATDPTLAARTALFDRNSGSWSDSLLMVAGVSKTMMPEVRPTGALHGRVSTDASEVTGLETGAIVAVGGHDHVCAAFAARGGADAAVHSCGTASGLLVPAAIPLDSRAGAGAHVASARDVDDRFIVSAPTGVPGRSLTWLAHLLYPEHEPGDAFRLMEDDIATPIDFTGLAGTADLDRPSSPRWDPLGAALSFAGISADHGRGTLIQAILETNAFSLRENLEWMEAHDLTVPDETLITGGAVQNRAWMDITASVLGRSIHVVSEPQTAALAGALLGGTAAGVFGDVREAAASMRPVSEAVDPPAGASVLFDRAYTSVYLPTRRPFIDLHRIAHDYDHRLD